jgi:hypothetical protein
VSEGDLEAGLPKQQKHRGKPPKSVTFDTGPGIPSVMGDFESKKPGVSGESRVPARIEAAVSKSLQSIRHGASSTGPCDGTSTIPGCRFSDNWNPPSACCLFVLFFLLPSMQPRAAAQPDITAREFAILANTVQNGCPGYRVSFTDEIRESQGLIIGRSRLDKPSERVTVFLTGNERVVLEVAGESYDIVDDTLIKRDFNQVEPDWLRTPALIALRYETGIDFRYWNPLQKYPEPVLGVKMTLSPTLHGAIAAMVKRNYENAGLNLAKKQIDPVDAVPIRGTMIYGENSKFIYQKTLYDSQGGTMESFAFSDYETNLNLSHDEAFFPPDGLKTRTASSFKEYQTILNEIHHRESSNNWNHIISTLATNTLRAAGSTAHPAAK